MLFLFLPMGSRSTIGSVLVGRSTPPAHYGVVLGLLGIGNSLGSALALLGVAVAALATCCLTARG